MLNAKKTERPLTADALDKMLTPRRRRTLWGLDEVARYLGISREKAKRLARLSAVPIHKPEGSGTYCAEPDDLDQWKRGKRVER